MSGLVNLVLSCQTGIFQGKHPFIDKPMVITEPTVASAWLLGSGLNLHPSNKPCMLNKDLNSIHAESCSGKPKPSKRKKGSAGRVLPMLCHLLRKPGEREVETCFMPSILTLKDFSNQLYQL